MKKMAALFLLCTSCTMTMQNISTHGTATDLVDDTLSNEASANIPQSQ